jgi:hypothetical protein
MCICESAPDHILQEGDYAHLLGFILTRKRLKHL